MANDREATFRTRRSPSILSLAFHANQRYQARHSPRQARLLGGLSHGIHVFVRAGCLFGDTAIGTRAYKHILFGQIMNQLPPLPEFRGLRATQMGLKFRWPLLEPNLFLVQATAAGYDLSHKKM